MKRVTLPKREFSSIGYAAILASILVDVFLIGKCATCLVAIIVTAFGGYDND